jgi:predicted DNA-binding protein (MmcQ/YjbR family)
MTVEDIDHICRKLPHITQDIKWGHDLCYNIGEKMFLVIGVDNVPVSASFKVPDELFDEMTARKGIIPAPYLARYKWVYTDDINRLSKKEWEQFIKQSYELIKAKLPKKVLNSFK